MNFSKEQFESMYITKNMSYEEIANEIGCSVRQLRRRNSEWKINKTPKNIAIKRAETFERKYGEGITSARQIKEIQTKIEEEYFKKYGVRNPSQNKDVSEKRKKNYFEKTGFYNPFSNPIIKDKIKKFYKINYGEHIINPLQIPEIKSKIKRINRFSHGLKHNHSTDKILILDSKESFTEYILTLPESERNIISISKLLNYDESTIGRYIHEFSIENIVDIHSNRSSYEKEIITFLKNELFIENIQENVKGLFENKLLEADIYIPNLNLVIEFNGSYWHSEKFKQTNYHQNKSLSARASNLFIYNIFEYEWINPIKKEKIKNALKILVNGAERKIYARKCYVRKLTKEEKSNFLNENHFQGNDNSLIAYGLFNGSELLSLMSFCKPRFSKGFDWELSRFCNKFDVQVIGGGSKLLSAFIKENCKSGERILTYSDIARVKGNVYESIGFKQKSISKPSYIWWRNHSNIKTRYQCQIKNEIQTMQEQGYLRIFDSGNIVWEYVVKE